MADGWELELDHEAVKVRKFLERQYLKAGLDDFLALRLSMRPDIDWHQVVAAAQNGASNRLLEDLYLD